MKKTVLYFAKNVGTASARAKFRVNKQLMEAARTHFVQLRCPSFLVMRLVKRLSNITVKKGRVISVLTKKAEPAVFTGNPFEFQNGSYIHKNGNGWYTAYGDGETANSCFVALNALMNFFFHKLNPSYRTKRPTRYVLKETNKFRYTPHTLGGVPIKDKFYFNDEKKPYEEIPTKKPTVEDLIARYQKEEAVA